MQALQNKLDSQVRYLYQESPPSRRRSLRRPLRRVTRVMWGWAMLVSLGGACGFPREQGAGPMGQDAAADVDAPGMATDAKPPADAPKPDAPGPQRVTQGLVALYHFDEMGNATSAKDATSPPDNLAIISGGGNDPWDFENSTLIARNKGIVAVSNGNSKGSCLGATGVTAEAWIDPMPSNNDFRRVMRYHAERGSVAGTDDTVFGFRFNDNGILMQLADGTTAYQYPLQLGNMTGMHHWVLRFNGSKLEMFRDGQPVPGASIDASGVKTSRFPARGRFELLSDIGSAIEVDQNVRLLGTIALAAWYCRPLSNDEIAANFAVGAAGR